MELAMYDKETEEERELVYSDIKKLSNKHYWEMAELKIKLVSIHDNYACKQLKKHTQGSAEWKAIQKKYFPQYN